MLLTTLATIAATVWLYVLIPKGFLPEQNTGLLLGTAETSQYAHSPPWLSGSAAHVTFGISQSTA
jgi:multidrug efflux pump subunit AcrB